VGLGDPVALGVGIDLVAVAGVAQSLGGPNRDRYLERVYTPREVDDCRDPSGRIDPERLAARFAAKEAAIKALPGAGEGVGLTQVEVVRADSGQVTLRLSRRAAELFSASGATEIVVSLAHEDTLAVAAVVIA
jgi:holo-[acyl-carrier protein] synthase